jgi:Domain of unknown function (DUF6456)
MRLIIPAVPSLNGLPLSYNWAILAVYAKHAKFHDTSEVNMKRQIIERELACDNVNNFSEEKHKNRPSGEMRGRAGISLRKVTVNLAESPVSWLFARGHLNQRQHDAGDRLRLDWELAQLAPRVTMHWDPVRARGGGGAGLTPTERQIVAKQRFDGAIAQAGNGLSDVLWRVVCAGESLADAERAMQWPSRSGKLVLRFALDRVADFYRIT